MRIDASAVTVAISPNVTFLFVGRVLQTAGSGLALGAATASLVENSTTVDHRFARSPATVPVLLAYCVGAIFFLLEAHLIGQFAHTTNAATVVVLLGYSSAAGSHTHSHSRAGWA